MELYLCHSTIEDDCSALSAIAESEGEATELFLGMFPHLTEDEVNVSPFDVPGEPSMVFVDLQPAPPLTTPKIDYIRLSFAGFDGVFYDDLPDIIGYVTEEDNREEVDTSVVFAGGGAVGGLDTTYIDDTARAKLHKELDAMIERGNTFLGMLSCMD
jgi:hypothetical protein